MKTAAEYIRHRIDKTPPEALEGMETNFYFDLSGEGGGQFSVVVQDGKAEVHEGKHGEPKCELKLDAQDFIKLLRGEMNPVMAVMTGKVKVSNTGELLKNAKLLGMG